MLVLFAFPQGSQGQIRANSSWAEFFISGNLDESYWNVSELQKMFLNTVIYFPFSLFVF